jgi:hypothetical protein
MSITDTLTKLAQLFNVNYNEELDLLYKAIKIGKQYIYDNKQNLKNYITKLEDIKDNLNQKICNPHPYKLHNGKYKILWLICNDNMKKNIKNYYIKKLAISQYFIDITYNYIPKSKYNFKLLILLGFDVCLYKTVLIHLVFK